MLVGTIAFIAGYGTWLGRSVGTARSYLKGEGVRWPTIGLSIMATQASAITFLSVPGQAYEDGMRFVQFYFGLPLAMVIISAVFVPIYYRSSRSTRPTSTWSNASTCGCGCSRRFCSWWVAGWRPGSAIYAPAIILSSLLGWSARTR